MDDALVTVAPTGTNPEGPTSPVGTSTPQQPKEPASRWKRVRLGKKSAVSEVLGTAEGPTHGVMRVYEATIEYHLVSLGDDVKLDRPEKIYRYMADILEKFPMNETLWVVLLNRKGKAIARHLCTSGTLTGSLVHPREVFRPAFLAGASSVVVVHNHPSGDPSPSSADLQVTRRLREASSAVDVELLDHVILGRPESDPAGKGYYSFREAGIV